MNTASLLHQLFQHKAWANRETFAELEKLDGLKHPQELHNALRILNHIYVVDRIWAAHLTGGEHHYAATNTAETPTLAGLRDAVFATDQWYVDYTRDTNAQVLQEVLHFTYTDGQAGSMSREEMLAHVVTHGGYHRGAAGRIMLQAGLTLPRDSVSVYLHQAEPQRRSQERLIT